MVKKVCIFLIHFQLPPMDFCLSNSVYGSIHETHYSGYHPVFPSISCIQILLIGRGLLVRKPILSEAQIMYDSNLLYVCFHSTFISDPNICICMEFMGKGLFGQIYKQIGPIDIDVIGKTALAVLERLTYLYDVCWVIHQDELLTTPLSIPFPMSLPTQDRIGQRRIRQRNMEVCPWGARTVNILELLCHIVNEPALRLTSEGRFLRATEELIVTCLLKDPEVRKTPKELLVSDFPGPQCVCYLG